MSQKAASWVYHTTKFMTRRKKTDPEAVMKMIQEHQRRTIDLAGPRRGWQVKAAAWVKKWHIDRGDVKVGFRQGRKGFHIVDSLLPRYVVPDLEGFPLKPYVSEVEPKEDVSSKGGGAAAQTANSG